MNIIPFILFLILALAAYTASFFQKGIDLKIETQTMVSFAKTERESERNIQEISFKKVRAAKKEQKKYEKKKSCEERDRIARRREATGTTASKLNIFSLFTDSPLENAEKTFSALLHTLYDPHFSPEAISTLATSLTTRGRALLAERKKENNASLEIALKDLYPEDQATLYYALLRGTRYYNLETREGYPPLSDLVYFDPSGKLFQFKTAAPAILTAYFGASLTERLLDKEGALLRSPTEKRKDLTKSEIEQIVRGSASLTPLAFDIPNLLEEKLYITTLDPSTKLLVDKRTD